MLAVDAKGWKSALMWHPHTTIAQCRSCALFQSVVGTCHDQFKLHPYALNLDCPHLWLLNGRCIPECPDAAIAAQHAHVLIRLDGPADIVKAQR